MEHFIQEPNPDELTEKGFTNRIHIHEGQTKDSLIAQGFTHHNPAILYFCRMVTPDISFNLSIAADSLKIESIDVLDERFLQPYDYQKMILDGNPPEMVIEVYRKINQILDNLQTLGVITGFEKGMYI